MHPSSLTLIIIINICNIIINHVYDMPFWMLYKNIKLNKIKNAILNLVSLNIACKYCLVFV